MSVSLELDLEGSFGKMRNPLELETVEMESIEFVEVLKWIFEFDDLDCLETGWPSSMLKDSDR